MSVNTERNRTMATAKIWIEHNPETGAFRPWEVFFVVDGGKVRKIAHCESEQGATKAAAAAVKRNTAAGYQVDLIAAR